MLCFCGFSASIIPMLVKSRSLSSFEELVNYEPININVAFLAYFQVYLIEHKKICRYISIIPFAVLHERQSKQIG